MRLLFKEPRSRSKEDIKILQSLMHELLKDILFGPSQANKYKFTDSSINIVITDLFKTTVKLVTAPFG